MKREYVRPQVLVEEFVANQAIAASCSSEAELVFECMKGPQTDTANVISNIPAVGVGTCAVNVGYAEGAIQAVELTGGQRHSNNSDCLTWSTSGPLTATANSDAVKGFIYICASKNDDNSPSDYHTNCWTYDPSSKILTHNGLSSSTYAGGHHGGGHHGGGPDDGCYHIMMAPVIGVVSIGS